MGFPGGSVIKNLAANEGVIGDNHSISGSGRLPEGKNDNSSQYSCQENTMDRGAWSATVHGITKNQTQLVMHENIFIVISFKEVFCEIFFRPGLWKVTLEWFPFALVRNSLNWTWKNRLVPNRKRSMLSLYCHPAYLTYMQSTS